jgi:hypothetical protein
LGSHYYFRARFKFANKCNRPIIKVRRRPHFFLPKAFLPQAVYIILKANPAAAHSASVGIIGALNFSNASIAAIAMTTAL